MINIAQHTILWGGYHLAMAKKASKSDLTTIQIVEGWLNALCAVPPEPCSKCGSLMVHKCATFFLPEGEKSWTIPLPICSNCEPSFERTIAAA
jgi:hypothetical protein